MSKKEMIRWGAKMCMSLLIGAAAARLGLFGVVLLVLWIAYVACDSFLKETPTIEISIEPIAFNEEKKKEPEERGEK